MGFCSYCNEYPTDGYWAYYCSECAMLRRLLKIHNSKKCCEILKRVLIRDSTQIGYKIKNEIKDEPVLNGGKHTDLSASSDKDLAKQKMVLRKKN